MRDTWLGGVFIGGLGCQSSWWLLMAYSAAGGGVTSGCQRGECSLAWLFEGDDNDGEGGCW